MRYGIRTPLPRTVRSDAAMADAVADLETLGAGGETDKSFRITSRASSTAARRAGCPPGRSSSPTCKRTIQPHRGEDPGPALRPQSVCGNKCGSERTLRNNYPAVTMF